MVVQCLCGSGFYDWNSAIFFVVVCTDITDTLFLHKLQIIQQISSGQVIL